MGGARYCSTQFVKNCQGEGEVQTKLPRIIHQSQDNEKREREEIKVITIGLKSKPRRKVSLERKISNVEDGSLKIVREGINPKIIVNYLNKNPNKFNRKKETKQTEKIASQKEDTHDFREKNIGKSKEDGLIETNVFVKTVTDEDKERNSLTNDKVDSQPMSEVVIPQIFVDVIEVKNDRTTPKNNATFKHQVYDEITTAEFNDIEEREETTTYINKEVINDENLMTKKLNSEIDLPDENNVAGIKYAAADMMRELLKSKTNEISNTTLTIQEHTDNQTIVLQQTIADFEFPNELTENKLGNISLHIDSKMLNKTTETNKTDETSTKLSNGNENTELILIMSEEKEIEVTTAVATSVRIVQRKESINETKTDELAFAGKKDGLLKEVNETKGMGSDKTGLDINYILDVLKDIKIPGTEPSSDFKDINEEYNVRKTFENKGNDDEDYKTNLGIDIADVMTSNKEDHKKEIEMKKRRKNILEVETTTDMYSGDVGILFGI